MRPSLGIPATLFFLGLALFLPAASTSEPTTDATLPPGYEGSETCNDCHDDIGEAFGSTAHGRIDTGAWHEVGGCESCHGPGTAHAEDTDPELIAHPSRMTTSEISEVCLSCHSGAEMGFWHGSEHQTADLACTSCHEIHQAWTSDHALANRNINDGCLSCHQDMRKHMVQRSRHPLREGLMSCTDCHSPHGSAIEASLDGMFANDVCYSCHNELRGPFLWEHAPVREDCLTCHDAHGSNQRSMLVKSAPRLCQSCHLFGHHQTVAGEPTQVWNLNRSCVNCHHSIHGSNHPSGVIFMQ